MGGKTRRRSRDGVEERERRSENKRTSARQHLRAIRTPKLGSTAAYNAIESLKAEVLGNRLGACY